MTSVELYWVVHKTEKIRMIANVYLGFGGKNKISAC